MENKKNWRSFFFLSDPIWPQEYKLYYIVTKASATAPGMCLCDLYLLELNSRTRFWASVLPVSNFCKLHSCQYLRNWPLFCFLNHVYVEGSQNKQCTTNYITLFDLLIKNHANFCSVCDQSNVSRLILGLGLEFERVQVNLATAQK